MLKKINGYPDYSVDEYGNVYSKRKKLKGTVTNGYLVVSLYKNKICKIHRIHQLVAETFLGKHDGLEVNHIDGIKTNNCLNNLEYVTGSENMKHAFRIGLQSLKGTKASMAILNWDLVCKIRNEYLSTDTSYSILGNKYGVHRQTIASLIRRETWNYEEDPNA